MNPKTAAETYRQSSIENAPPVQIVRLLYEGALRYIDRAAASDPQTDFRAFADWVGRADAIVTELRVSLEHEPAPEVAKGLDRVYEYAQHQFGQAIVRRDLQPLADARKALATLLEGWRQIELTTIGA